MLRQSGVNRRKYLVYSPGFLRSIQIIAVRPTRIACHLVICNDPCPDGGQLVSGIRSSIRLIPVYQILAALAGFRLRIPPAFRPLADPAETRPGDLRRNSPDQGSGAAPRRTVATLACRDGRQRRTSTVTSHHSAWAGAPAACHRGEGQRGGPQLLAGLKVAA